MKKNTDSSNKSRRTFLQYTGLTATGAMFGSRAGAVPFELSQASSAGWNVEADIVVVGSGAAGCSAGIFAKEMGADVLMLEKTSVFGGTTLKSGGVFWVPNNAIMRRAGIEDPKEDAVRYMLRLSFPQKYNIDSERYGVSKSEYELIELVYDEGYKTIDELTSLGVVDPIPWIGWDGKPYPDYFSHLPENKAPRGRALVPKYPSPNDPRNGTGLGNGAELIRQLRFALESRNVSIKMGKPVERVITNKNSEVVGLEVQPRTGETVYVRAKKAVVFASGGYTHNIEYRQNFLRGPIYGGCAAPGSEGDFIKVAGACGAAMGNLNNAWWAQQALELALEISSTPDSIWAIPGDSMVQVNKYGRRFANEKFPYNERTQAHFLWDPVKAEYPNLISFIIFDRECVRKYGGYHPLPGDKLEAAPEYVIRGEDFASLVSAISERLSKIKNKIGGFELDKNFGENLYETIRRFNEMARQGKDLDFHRGELAVEANFHYLYLKMTNAVAPDVRYPNKLMQPFSDHGPYFCVLACAGTLDTKGGPKVNKAMQVIDTYGEKISGLYAAGNCTAHPAGQAYWAGGATIGSALTMGRIAGINAAKEEVKPVE